MGTDSRTQNLQKRKLDKNQEDEKSGTALPEWSIQLWFLSCKDSQSVTQMLIAQYSQNTTSKTSNLGWLDILGHLGLPLIDIMCTSETLFDRTDP